MNTGMQLTQLDNGNLCIVVPMLIKRMRGRKTIILPDGQTAKEGEFSEAVQLPLAKAVARAFAWTEALESGSARMFGGWQSCGSSRRSTRNQP